MVIDMYIIGPKKDQFKLVFFSLFDFSKMKKTKTKTAKDQQMVFFSLGLVWS